MPYLKPLVNDDKEEISDLKAFIEKEADDYQKGMNGINLGHVMRETAKYNNCDFVDLLDRNNVEVEQEIRAQKDSGQDILLCSPQFITPKEDFLKQLIDRLKIVNNTKSYKKIMIPIGANDYDGPNHLMALVIEGKTAYIFEQFGEKHYEQAKNDLSQALQEAGYNFYKSTKPLTKNNRLDCGTVTTHVITEAIRADSLETLSKKINQNSPLFSAQEIDEQHKLDQQYASFALKDIQEGHRDDHNKSEDVLLLQKLLYKSSSLDLQNRLSLVSEFWNADNKEEFVATYKSPNDEEVLTVDGQLPEADPDQKWKDEVRQAVRKANDQLQNNFQEYQNNDYPKHLFFKDGNNDLAFASKQQAYVGGEQKAFNELCATAVNLGKNTINFGKFEKHPEYKAMLYLACLKHGLKMSGNIPSEAELKNSPQYAEIQKCLAPQKREELRQKLAHTKKEYLQGKTNAYLEPKYKEAFDAVQAAEDTYNKDKSEDNKKALDAARQTLEETEAYKLLQRQKRAYQDTLREAADFYVQFGSGNPNDTSTPEERRTKLDNHLKQYDPKEFFSKDKDGKPLEKELTNKKDLITKYQFVHQTLKNREK